MRCDATDRRFISDICLTAHFLFLCLVRTLKSSKFKLHVCYMVTSLQYTIINAVTVFPKDKLLAVFESMHDTIALNRWALTFLLSQDVPFSPFTVRFQVPQCLLDSSHILIHDQQPAKQQKGVHVCPKGVIDLL